MRQERLFHQTDFRQASLIDMVMELEMLAAEAELEEKLERHQAQGAPMGEFEGLFIIGSGNSLNKTKN